MCAVGNENWKRIIKRDLISLKVIHNEPEEEESLSESDENASDSGNDDTHSGEDEMIMAEAIKTDDENDNKSEEMSGHKSKHGSGQSNNDEKHDTLEDNPTPKDAPIILPWDDIKLIPNGKKYEVPNIIYADVQGRRLNREFNPTRRTTSLVITLNQEGPFIQQFAGQWNNK